MEDPRFACQEKRKAEADLGWGNRKGETGRVKLRVRRYAVTVNYRGESPAYKSVQALQERRRGKRVRLLSAVRPDAEP